MAVEDKPATPVSEEMVEGEQNEQDETLRGLLRGEEDSIEEDDKETDAQEESLLETTPSPAPADYVKLQERLYQIEAENNVIKGLLAQRDQPPIVKEEDEEEEVALTGDEAIITQGLRTNPAKTILDLVNKGIAQAVEKATKTATKQSSAQLQEQNKRASLQEADQQKTLVEYGAFLSDENFKSLAGQYYADLTKDKEWVPNAIFTAAALAHSQMVRAGKLMVPGKVTAMKTKKPSNQMLAASTVTPGESGVEKEFSAEQLKAVDKVCKDWGLTREQYFKSYQDQKKKDPMYGTGR
jgi:hypothetical protein